MSEKKQKRLWIILILIVLIIVTGAIFLLPGGSNVKIETRPENSEIIIDEKDPLKTPLTLKLKPGKHSLILRGEGFEPVTDTLTISKNDTTLVYELQPITSQITIKSIPDSAMVWIDGVEKGQTPLEMKLGYGTYQLKITHAGYQDIEAVYEASHSGDTLLQYQLEPLKGKLIINSEPSGAKVYLNQEEKGTTPFDQETEYGDYQLELKLQGYGVHRQKIKIESEEGYSQTVQLKKIEKEKKAQPEKKECEFGTFTDPRDGYTYKTVKIGNQVWLAENLRATKYRNGDPIPNVKDSKKWIGLKTGAYCAYDNDESNAKIYGYLYNWYAVKDPRGLAPEGWHVPTDEEWTELEEYLIANGYNYNGSTTGDKIGKSLTSTSGWTTGSDTGDIGNDQQSNNSTGFSALPSGYRFINGSFKVLTNYAYFWSSTEYDNDTYIAWGRYLTYNLEGLYREFSSKRTGFSLRCVRD